MTFPRHRPSRTPPPVGLLRLRCVAAHPWQARRRRAPSARRSRSPRHAAARLGELLAFPHALAVEPSAGSARRGRGDGLALRVVGRLADLGRVRAHVLQHLVAHLLDARLYAAHDRPRRPRRARTAQSCAGARRRERARALGRDAPRVSSARPRPRSPRASSPARRRPRRRPARVALARGGERAAPSPRRAPWRRGRRRRVLLEPVPPSSTLASYRCAVRERREPPVVAGASHSRSVMRAFIVSAVSQCSLSASRPASIAVCPRAARPRAHARGGSPTSRGGARAPRAGLAPRRRAPR